MVDGGILRNGSTLILLLLVSASCRVVSAGGEDWSETKTGVLKRFNTVICTNLSNLCVTCSPTGEYACQY